MTAYTPIQRARLSRRVATANRLHIPVHAALDPEPRGAERRRYETPRELPRNDLDFGEWPPSQRCIADLIDDRLSLLGMIMLCGAAIWFVDWIVADIARFGCGG